MQSELKFVDPMQSAMDQSTLMSHAKEAQQILKDQISQGSSWTLATEHEAEHYGEWKKMPGGGKITNLQIADEAYDPGPKSLDGVERKVQGKYKGNYSRLRDVARMAFQYNGPQKLFMALQDLRNIFRFVKFENRFNTPTSLGWMDITILVEILLPGNHWHVCELQMQLLEFTRAREEKGAHEFYEVMRKMLPEECKVPLPKLDSVIERLLQEFRGGPPAAK